MDRRKYLKVSGSIAATSALGVAGCMESVQGTETLEFWHDKGDWQEFFAEALEEVNALLDDREGNLELEQVPKTEEYQAAVRPVLGTENGPAVFTWWVGNRLRQLVDDDFAHDITGIWEDYIDQGAYPEGLMNSFGVDGRAYAVPTSVSYWVVWYKPSTFDALGVEPPESWDDFLSLCDTILDESGGETTPINIPLSSTWTGFTWWSEFVIGQSPDFYDRVSAGDASYTDEESVTALETLGDMVSEGYFGDTERLFSLEFPDMIREIENEESAMFLMGDWVSNPIRDVGSEFENWDWFAVPNMDSSVAPQMVSEPQPIVPHAGYPDVDALETVTEVLMTKEVQKILSEKINYIPSHNEVSTDHLPDNKARLADELDDFEFVLRYWENAPASVAPPASETMAQIFSEPDNAESIAEEIDKIQQDNQ